MSNKTTTNPFNIIVIVAALGYFVDIYDLILFGIVMKPSLKAIGIPDEMMFDVGGSLLGMQMIGMLVGGIVWGVLGDKKGRLSTLFLTILLYSLANIANGFIQNIEQYKMMRFIAGFGLAGELGVGITLVSEVMTKESRGIGTSIVAGIGILGAVLGFLVADLFDWRMAYWVGGGLGLMLLVLRISVYESGMFEKTKQEKVSRGNILSLFASGKNLKKYLLSICVGIPVWYVISQLTVQSSAYAKELNITGEVVGGKAVMFHYIGASLGSLIFGLLSEKLRSRKKALMTATGSLAVFISFYFFMKGISPAVFYTLIGLLGISMGGLWTVFMTNASEQFGTNIRSTVTTTAPNFVRGTTELIRLSITSMRGSMGLWSAGLIIGVVVIVISLASIMFSEETHGKDLDYNE
ncbi:MAG: MFS transporter [Bacteroidetes bacterium]|nr:MAG: MFS transporter [Bacteroidota bacterium]